MSLNDLGLDSEGFLEVAGTADVRNQGILIPGLHETLLQEFKSYSVLPRPFNHRWSYRFRVDGGRLKIRIVFRKDLRSLLDPAEHNNVERRAFLRDRRVQASSCQASSYCL